MLAFDTHTYIKELQAVGFTEEQAEVQARTLKNIIDNDLANKQDIAEIKQDIAELKRDIKELETKTETRIKELETKTETNFELVRREIKELETKTETRIKELELQLTLRLGGMLVIGIGVVATLVKLL